MQILRGVKLSTKLLAFLFLVLGTASSLALVHPQPVNAEGYLFGKLRCTVRTIFNRECEKAAQPVVEEPKQGGVTTNDQGTAAPKPGAAPVGGANTTTSNTGGAALEPVEIPEELLVGYDELNLPEVSLVTEGERVNESEYTTYFNTFSPYAVAGAHTVAATGEAPVERSAEGWKLFGVAWYWWAAMGLVVGVFIAYGRNVLKARTTA